MVQFAFTFNKRKVVLIKVFISIVTG